MSVEQLQKPVSMIKKMTAKNMVGSVRKVMMQYCKDDLDKVPLFTVIGVANGVKTGEHAEFGEWNAFRGSFEAECHVNGELFASNLCFLPEPLSSMLIDALKESDDIQFVITVEVKRRDDLAVGYEYVPIPHIKATGNDPLAHLRGIAKASISLPAPVSEPVSEPVAIPEKSPRKNK